MGGGFFRYTEDQTEKLEVRKRRHFSIRLNLFFFVTFVLFSVLIVKLAILQFVEGKYFKEIENLVSNSQSPIAPIRGTIYDRTGYAIAQSRSMQSLYYRVEGRAANKEEIIELAKMLEGVFADYGSPYAKPLSAAEILKRMDVGFDLEQNKTKEPSYYSVPRRIKEDLSQKEIAYLLERRDQMKGIEIFEDSVRLYDNQMIAAQLVGYMKRFSAARNPQSGLEYYRSKTDEYLDVEDVGFDGIELMYQEELRGKKGSKSYPVNASQKIVGPATVVPPQKGHNLYLTIDKDIQLATEKAITDHLAFIRNRSLAGQFAYAPNARSGYAVAMEVKTGKVVAMASLPDYDTNLWTGGMSTEQYNNIMQFVNNGTITTSYPDFPAKELGKHPSSIVYMGSVVKPLTILVGMNEGVISPNSTYYDSGSFSFGAGGNATIRNSDGYANGTLNPTSAIQKSSNTFMSAMVALPLYNKYGGEKSKVLDVWAEYMAKFGLGIKTGSNLPNEYAGSNEFFKNAKGSSTQSAMVYASWGQNEKYTTLQLAQYAATLANRGKRMQPQFVDKIVSSEGELVKGFEPVVLDEVSFPKVYWDTVINGMKSGAAGIEDLPYPVARKTGTSTQEVPGGTVDNAVLISFAPANNPVLAVAVVVPEGQFGRYGASPIAAKIYEAYDQYIGGLSGKAPTGAVAGANGQP
ncbi:peptidoglycan D,D-transpeptidase FtsI family protein [Paenibacillus sp. NPDC056579]|uniref:peptidoglycan D,D-transpeptidase FtsI family protein n=1 Tax=unclassified Paenibacillus TaxID=185978 RepID=UPI001EF8B171|nr:penicillin-binding transpeptidase domain-containing protein [Paenibacillus sp. H1-7]ULL13768.1 penicillin-binding protein 2 [Paenibacillus sp. H1-7]